MSASLDLPTFVARWQAATLTEKASAQQHFTELCRLLGQMTPAEADPAGEPRAEAIAQAARELVQKQDAWLNPPGTGDAELKKQMLTDLYSQQPTWLDLAHQALDRAVLTAYGWPADLSDDDLLARLLALNLARAATVAAGA